MRRRGCCRDGRFKSQQRNLAERAEKEGNNRAKSSGARGKNSHFSSERGQKMRNGNNQGIITLCWTFFAAGQQIYSIVNAARGAFCTFRFSPQKDFEGDEFKSARLHICSLFTCQIPLLQSAFFIYVKI